MKRKITAFLRKHPSIDYWQRCIRHRKDPDFVAITKAVNRNPDLLFFTHRGDEQADKYFYDIHIDYPSKGFFALFNQTLDALKYGHKFGLVPVVTWSDRCLYKEEEPIYGTDNPFCYFFEPVSSFVREDLAKACHVLEYRDYQRSIDENHPFTVVAKTIVENNRYDEYIRENGEIYRKYIHLKPQVQECIQTTVESIGFSGRILGVHVRATDFKKGYVNHAVQVESNEYIEATRQALQQCQFDKIFLATDEASVTEEFCREFGSRVIFCNDVFRSLDGEAVHFSQNSRSHHRYKMGLEVIRDMVLLSKCDGLIGGFSNVCIAAQIAKNSYGEPYQYLNIIDKGFVKNGITTYQDHFTRRT